VGVIFFSNLLVKFAALENMVGDHQDGVAHRHGGFLGATGIPFMRAYRPERWVPLAFAAACAAPMRALRSHFEPLRVLPERRLPADSSLPGHIPAQEAKW
jgi:hypothetical protein